MAAVASADAAADQARSERDQNKVLGLSGSTLYSITPGICTSSTADAINVHASLHE